MRHGSTCLVLGNLKQGVRFKWLSQEIPTCKRTKQASPNGILLSYIDTLGPPPAFHGSRGVQNVQNISSDTTKTVTSVARFDDARLSVSDAKNTVNDDLVGSLSHSKLASKNSGKAS